jgi:hypothetical protein
MNISEIKVSKALKERVTSLVGSLKEDEVLTTNELVERLNLSGTNGRLCKILSGLDRKRVVIHGDRQWVYGNKIALQSLESQINRGSLENR